MGRVKSISASLGGQRHGGRSLGIRKNEKGKVVEEHREKELLRLTSFYRCCLFISCGWSLHFIEANSALQGEEYMQCGEEKGMVMTQSQYWGLGPYRRYP